MTGTYCTGIGFELLLAQAKDMMSALPKSVVFITGTFIGNNCWDEWKSFFESKGYKCIAPAWPYKDASPEELRNRHPDTAIASNNLDDLVDHFDAIIRSLTEQPVLIGHSLGGLIVQLLLQRGLGAAGIAIHSSPPHGACAFRLSFLKAIWVSLGLFTPVEKTYMISFSKWKYAITNTLTCEQQKEFFYQYAVPESKRIIRDTFKCSTKIDFKKPHAPLLFTSGSNDKMIPALVNYCNYKKYLSGDSVTDYKEFKDQTHLVFGHPLWRREADFILEWLEGIK